MLKWRLAFSGNNAFDVGVLPAAYVSLHTGIPDGHHERQLFEKTVPGVVGFHSVGTSPGKLGLAKRVEGSGMFISFCSIFSVHLIIFDGCL